MRSLKSYRYKISILLIAIGSMFFLYRYGYGKNFDQESIPKNADGIAMVDLKNVRNYLVFSDLKNPSEYKLGNWKFKNRFDFSDFGISTPDYFAFFHLENQPLTQWFVTAKIENEIVFEKTLAKIHFRKVILQNGMTSYCSIAESLFIVKYRNQILISNISEKQTAIAIKTAEDLFYGKLFLDTKRIEKTIDTDNAATFWIKKNSFLENDGILNLKLTDHEITVDGQLRLKPKFKKEWQFSQHSNALLSLGFSFEMLRHLNILKQHSDLINKIIGFDLDSILVHNPTKTELVLNQIIEKKDSAVSFSYDDDFNPIKKVALHISREPSFYFSMQTVNSKKIYHYLKSQNAVDNSAVFVNFPLALTKTSFQDNTFTLTANPVKSTGFEPSIPKIGFLKVHFNKLRKEDWHYLTTKNRNFKILKSFETLTINLDKQNNVEKFSARLVTRKNISALF